MKSNHKQLVVIRHYSPEGEYLGTTFEPVKGSKGDAAGFLQRYASRMPRGRMIEASIKRVY